MIVVGDGLRCGVALNAGILSGITPGATGIVRGLASPVRGRFGSGLPMCHPGPKREILSVPRVGTVISGVGGGVALGWCVGGPLL